MYDHQNKERIIIVDFGSQLTKLIARRIREIGVFSEVLRIDKFKKIKDFQNIKGVILSGGPSTVTNKKFPDIPSNIFSLHIPILGICYGLQLIVKKLNGKVKSFSKEENLEEQY